MMQGGGRTITLLLLLQTVDLIVATGTISWLEWNRHSLLQVWYGPVQPRGLHVKTEG